MVHDHGIDDDEIHGFAWDVFRANVFDYLRQLGPFEPHRLPLEEMEHTTMPEVADRLAERWEPLAATAAV
jgi:fructose 1,6-bisphosphatase